MANAATAEDHVTLNLGEGGAVIATDFVNQTNMGYGDSSAGPAHFQVVKLSTGGAGEFALLSTSSPAPVQVWKVGDTDVSSGFLAVRGNTLGNQAVPVSLSGATLEVNDITVVGGTLDRVLGASADIRSVATGVTFTVVGIDGGTSGVAVRTEGLTSEVAVTGAVAISSVSLPTGLTAYTKTIADTAVLSFAGYTLESGVKIKNYFSGLEGLTPGNSGPGGGLLCVGASGSHFTAGCSLGYLLSPGEEVFLEIKNINTILATSVNFGSDEDFCNVSILGT